MELCLLKAGKSMLKIQESRVLPYLERTGLHVSLFLCYLLEKVKELYL